MGKIMINGNLFGSGTFEAKDITFDNGGGVNSSNVQDAIEEINSKVSESNSKSFQPELNIISQNGYTVTVTDGNTTFTSNLTNPIIKIPNYGNWNVKSSKDGFETETTVLVDTVKRYNVDVSATIMGIQRDITSPLTTWTRTHKSVGLSATATVGTTAGHSDFDTMPIYKDIQRVTVPTGDTMVKIPAFYYRRYRVGNVEHIEIADKQTTGFALHPAFDRGDYGTYNHIYVGAYKTSSGHKSVTGVSPLTNINRAAFRSNAKSKGAGWGIIDIATLSAIQMLILVEFANNDSQGTIGRGYCDGNSSALKTGTCDAVTNLTGIPVGTSGKTDVIWRGIEGFWGNVWEWTDGININNGIYYVSNNPNVYADNTGEFYEALTYTGATGWDSSYITEEGLDESKPWVMMPSAAGGNGADGKYYSDGAWSGTGWRAFDRGGYWFTGRSLAGLFTSYTNVSSSDANVGAGSRLQYLEF